MDECRIERSGGVARVTLDRPPLNVLTPALIAELGAALRGLAGDAELRLVVLAGAGRAFSAGVDVHAMRDLEPATARPFIAALHATIDAVRALPVPVLARLQGHVLGGALELVLACDLRLAAASCRLGMPEIRVGIPSVIEAALLPGLVGWGRTAELLLTGETIDAVEAERWGLVNAPWTTRRSTGRSTPGWADSSRCRRRPSACRPPCCAGGAGSTWTPPSRSRWTPSPWPTRPTSPGGRCRASSTGAGPPALDATFLPPLASRPPWTST